VQLQLAGLFNSEKRKVFKTFLICSPSINRYLNEICLQISASTDHDISQQISALWPSLWTNLERLTQKYKPTISTRSFRLQPILREQKLLSEHYNILLNATYNYLAPQVYLDLQV